MKKLVSMLGALCMLCTAVPALPTAAMLPTSAALFEDQYYENITYEQHENYVEITGTADSELGIQGELMIPSEIDGLPVTQIRATAFRDNTELTAVVIPSTVTSIGDYAFINCTNLTEVVFPDVMPEIGTGVFRGTGLMSSYQNLLSYRTYADHVEIEGFDDPKSGGVLVIPSEIDGLPVTVIKNAAFGFNKSLTAVILPDTLTAIEPYAFTGCKNLASITFPEVMPEIGENAFNDTAWLRTSEGENSLLIIDNVLLKGTGSTGDIIIPDGVTAIASNAFKNCEELTSVVIPDSVTSIGEQAFFECTSLTSVTIPDTVTSIGNYAFYACISLKSVRLPSQLETIGMLAFEFCDALEEVNIPEGITEISIGEFMHCNSLKSVVIPNTVTEIQNMAFLGTPMESIEIPDSVEFIGSGAFAMTGLTAVTLPDNAEIFGNPFYRCKNLNEITVSETNPNYTSEDGLLFSKDKSALLICNSNKTGEFTVPDSVTSIAGSAFAWCEELTSIVIPDSVEAIGGGAFYECQALTSVNLPKSMTTLEEGTFTRCNSLCTIEIPENITKICYQALNAVPNLQNVTIKNPDCEIYPNKTTIFNNTFRNGKSIEYDGIIRGYENSTAQAYAEAYGYQFESLGEKTVQNPETLQAEASEVKKGDVNGDGEINILDVIKANKSIFGKETLTEEQTKAADINGDSVPDSTDVLIIMKYIIRLIPELN